MTDQMTRARVEPARATRPGEEPKQARRVVRAERVVIGLVIAVIAYLVLVPLLYLLWETFVRDGQLSLQGFREAYAGPGLVSLVTNSLTFATGATMIGIAVGTLLAFLVARTDLPLKPVVVGAALVPLILPGILHTIAWIFLASPRTGFINRVLAALPGSPVVDVFSMGGMVLVEGLHHVPLAFLLMLAVFRSTDPSIEEAAMLAGATLPQIFRKITIPAVRPALLGLTLLLFIRSLEAFEVPALLGIPGRTWVFTSRIWSALRGYPLKLGEAGALALSLLLFTVLGVAIHRWFTRSGGDYETITGDQSRRTAMHLGPWKGIAVGFTMVYFGIAVVLPMAMLGYVATQPFFSPPGLDALDTFTLDNFIHVFSAADTLRAIRNSVVLGVGAATVVVALTLVAGWVVARSKSRGSGALDATASIPLVIPGLVMGLALLTVYLRFPVPIFGTLWILMIAYVTRYLPYGMRSSVGAMHQVGTDLEEEAKVNGASWWQTMRWIHLPLLLPALAAGWIYIFIVSMRELSSSILLYSPGNEVLSVTIMNYWQSGQLPKLAALGVVMVAILAVLAAVAWKLGSRLTADAT